MTVELNSEQVFSIRKSYLNILGMLLDHDKIESRFIRCLLKWGFQLNLTPQDVTRESLDISMISFKLPSKVEKLEAIYHLVYMIYLDKVVEDIELEVATMYANKLGFNSSVVSELFKSIATADYDENKPRNVRQEVLDFLKVYEPVD